MNSHLIVHRSPFIVCFAPLLVLALPFFAQRVVLAQAAALGELDPAEDLPLLVLECPLNNQRSELHRHHHRAVVVGERSYGKGSVQNIIPMEGQTSALKLTTASYWRPSGRNIHRFPESKDADEWGVKPDEGYEVPLKDEERVDYFLYRRDRDIVHGKPGVPLPPKPKTDKDKDKEKKPFVDRTLEKAMEYLRGRVEKVGAAAPVLPETADT